MLEVSRARMYCNPPISAVIIACSETLQASAIYRREPKSLPSGLEYSKRLGYLQCTWAFSSLNSGPIVLCNLRCRLLVSRVASLEGFSTPPCKLKRTFGRYKQLVTSFIRF